MSIVWQLVRTNCSIFEVDMKDFQDVPPRVEVEEGKFLYPTKDKDVEDEALDNSEDWEVQDDTPAMVICLAWIMRTRTRKGVDRLARRETLSCLVTWFANAHPVVGWHRTVGELLMPL
jgi:hypothetical protein